MAKKKNRAVAFIPTKDTIFEVDGEQIAVYEGVLYMIPHAVEEWWGFHLERTGHGRVLNYTGRNWNRYLV